MVREYIWLTVMFLLCSASILRADTIYMKNGAVIEGKIVSNDEGVIVIREKFEGFGYGESTHQMDNVTKVIKEDEVLIAAEDGANLLSLLDLREIIDKDLGEQNMVTGLYFKDKVYRLRYYYPISGNKRKDRARLEAIVFKILAIFSKHNIEGFNSLEIEATAVNKRSKGVLSKAEIMRREFEKYKFSPQEFSIKDISRFEFRDQSDFY